MTADRYRQCRADVGTMKTPWLLVLLFVGYTSAAIVSIPTLGEVEGSTTTAAWSGRTIHQFLSIKYAVSPSGERRFMPPEPAPAWSGVYNATQYRAGCPEILDMESLLQRPPEDDLEDCLTLSVYTPMSPEEATRLLPVMVYIHGGGFYEGGSYKFPPNYLLEHDVILVVPQYRLGPLGYLSLHTDGIPGNAGFMDQVLALRWINQHIRRFGGDNTQVTVFGQSAGGCSISLHLLSPIVEPYLFQKAIIQSGSSYADWAIDKNPLAVARAIYRQMTNDTDTSDVDKMENAFKSVSVLELFQATLMNYGATGMPNGLVARAVAQKAGTVKFLTKNPVDYLAMGEFRTVPMMAGVTKHDGTYVTTLIYDFLERFGIQNNDYFLRTNLTAVSLKEAGIVDDTGALTDIMENKYFKRVFDQDKSLTFADVASGVSDLLGVLTLKAQTLKQAKINLNYEPNSTYLYTFDYRGEHTRFGYGQNTSKYPFDGGVSHSNDLLYLFPYHYELPLNEEDTKMAKIMSDLWTSFAIYSKPTSAGINTQWPNMQRNKNGPYLHINSTMSYADNDFVDNEYMAVTNEEINGV